MEKYEEIMINILIVLCIPIMLCGILDAYTQINVNNFVNIYAKYICLPYTVICVLIALKNLIKLYK